MSGQITGARSETVCVSNCLPVLCCGSESGAHTENGTLMHSDHSAGERLFSAEEKNSFKIAYT